MAFSDISSANGDKAEFLSAFAKLLKSPLHADLHLYLGPQHLEHPAHYNILSVHTDFFDKAKAGGFKEGNEDKFYFTDHSTHAVQRLLEYVYTGDYATNDKSDEHEEDDHDLLKHSRVYVEADYFSIHKLKQLCADKFETDVEDLWKGDSLFGTIDIVYTVPAESNDPMRLAIIKTVKEHIRDLKGEEFKKLLGKHAKFAAELIMAMLEGDGKCGHCHRIVEF